MFWNSGEFTSFRMRRNNCCRCWQNKQYGRWQLFALNQTLLVIKKKQKNIGLNYCFILIHNSEHLKRARALWLNLCPVFIQFFFGIVFSRLQVTICINAVQGSTVYRFHNITQHDPNGQRHVNRSPIDHPYKCHENTNHSRVPQLSKAPIPTSKWKYVPNLLQT